jgi:hypothetical protein
MVLKVGWRGLLCLQQPLLLCWLLRFKAACLLLLLSDVLLVILLRRGLTMSSQAGRLHCYELQGRQPAVLTGTCCCITGWLLQVHV